MNIFNFYISRTDRDIDMGRKAFSKTYFSSVVSDDLNWKKQLINIRASILVSSCLYCTNEFWQMDSVWACIRSSMKLDNSRESWGGKHRQDRSPGSYPAHLHLHPAKKRGESDRRSTVTRSLWAIVRARRCYHSPWAFRLDGGGGTPQRGQSLRSRWIFNGIAEGIKKGGGKGAEEAEWRKKQKEKDTIIRITDRSVPISIFRSFLEKEIRLLSPVRNDCPPKPSLIHAISNCYYFIIGSI